MSRYVTITEESQTINKLLKKYSEKKISPANSNLRGTFKIVRYRKYPYSTEIDIEFTGQLFAKASPIQGYEWKSAEVYNQSGYSKIKITKFIKRYLFNELKNHARFFGIELNFVECVKKVHWV